jgi:prefoldin subunit 5
VSLSAAALTMSAAFFSVFGISLLFSGHYYSVMIMASTLEYSKFILSTFLYRYWKTVNTLMKSYMTIALMVLMLITSAGIYGFLSDAYQKTKESYSANSNNVTLLVNKKSYFKQQLDYSNNQLTSLNKSYNQQQDRLDTLYKHNRYQIGNRVESTISGNLSDIKLLNKNISALNDSIMSCDFQISTLETSNLKGELGPIIYISKILNKDIDVISQYFMLLFVFVFDPLAVCLIIAANYIYSGGGKTQDDILDAFKSKKEEPKINDPVSDPINDTQHDTLIKPETFNVSEELNKLQSSKPQAPPFRSSMHNG